MSDVLTMDEIRSRFDSEWVLIDEPQSNEAMQVQRGSVLFHSKDRDEVYRKVVELRPKRFKVMYTGAFPEDMEFLL